MTDIEKTAGVSSGSSSEPSVGHIFVANEVTSGYSGTNLLNRAVTPGGHPVDTSQPALPVYHRRIGDPTPLGLLSFATTTLVLSLFNVGARDVKHPNVIVGLCLGLGGLTQFMAGMWNFATGNTFGATAFSAYGSFWLSWAAVYWPSSGILTADYAPGELESALGIYLLGWFVLTLLLLPATFKSSIGLIVTFATLTCTFLLLAVGELQMSSAIHKAGGAMGLVTSFAAFYTGISGIYTPGASYFVLPVGDLTQRGTA